MEVKTAPAMDVVASPTDSGPVSANPAPEPQPAVHHPSHSPAKPATPPKPPKPAQDSGVTAAIIATVIIVLGLAAMAVFAYLKQTGKL